MQMVAWLAVPIMVLFAAAACRIQQLQDEARPESQGQFMLRYEPSLDVHGHQFHPLLQPPLLSPKPVPDAAPHLEQAA